MSGLNKQVVSIPLQQGIDTQESKALLENGKFITLQNAVFERGALGELHKRNGYLALPSKDINNNTLSNPSSLSAFNQELEMFNLDTMYSLAPALNSWVPRGRAPAIAPTERSISGGSVNQANPDMASTLGVSVYAWEQAGTTYFKVIDEVTGGTYQGGQLGTFTQTSPKVLVTASGQITIFTLSATGQLCAWPISTATPQAPLVLVVVSTSPATFFDAVVVSGNVVFAMYYLSVTTLGVANPSLSGFSQTATVSTSDNVIALEIHANGTSSVGLTYAFLVSVGTYRLVTYSYLTPSLSLSLGRTFVSTTFSNQPLRLAALYDSHSGNTYAFYDFNSGSLPVIIVSVFPQSSSFTAYQYQAGVQMASAPWSAGGQINILSVNPSVIQQTYFLLQGSTKAQVVGKYYPSNAGPASSKNRMPRPSTLSNGSYALAVTSQQVVNTVNGKPTAIIGVDELSLTYGGRVLGTQLGQNLKLATGSLVYDYDGLNLVEAGFNTVPEAPIVTGGASNITVQKSPPSSAVFTFPKLPNTSLLAGDGALIQPGEYISFCQGATGNTTTTGQFGNYAIQVVWFSVDGVGSAPFGASATVNLSQCAITSSMSAAQVASAFASAVGGFIGVSAQLITTNSVQVYYTLGSNGAYGPFATLSTSADCYQLQPGSASSASHILITCAPGAFYRSGQQLLFTWPTTIVPTGYPQGLTFAVDGYALVPQASTSIETNTIIVSILSSDSAYTVAQKLFNTLSAYQSGGLNFIGPLAIYGNSVIFGANFNGVQPAATVPTGVNSFAYNQPYQYVAVREWVDNQGLLHQSAPSPATTVYLPPFSGYIPQNTTVLTQPNNLTQKQGGDIAIYRTQSATGIGSVFQRVTSPASLLYDNPASLTPIPYIDQVKDVDLASNQVLYTSAGLVANSAPPAAQVVCSHQNRIWLAELEDPATLWYSQILSATTQGASGNAVEFSALQTIHINQSVNTQIGGPTVALTSLDGNLIVFQSNQIWYISGDGPDSTGNGQQFSNPSLVASSTNIGCRDPASVVLIPDGLIFKSNAGFYLLTRQLQLEYIGSPVKAYNSDVVTAATCIAGNSQVRFLSATGTTLIYDWFYKQWGTFTNHQGYDAIRAPGQVYVYTNTSGLVYQENPGSYLDVSQGYPMVVQTAYLKFANIQGFGKLWRALFKGFFPATQAFQVQILYDFSPTVTDTFVFHPGAAAPAGAWGVGDTSNLFGEAPNNVWGGGFSSLFVYADDLQFRVFPSNISVENCSFIIQDLPSYGSAVTYSLDALDIEVGVRTGAYKKLGANNSIG